MIAVDTSILVYAHREELPHHQPALEPPRHLAERPNLWALPVFCPGEFVRIASLVVLSPGERLWPLFHDALLEA